MSPSTTWMQAPSGSSVSAAAIYVPPTDSNIGRIAVVTDPQTATFALVEGLRHGQAEIRRHGARPGASDGMSCLPLTGARHLPFTGRFLTGGRRTPILVRSPSYHVFAAGGRTIGGMLTKLARAPVPFWLYYFNVGDIDVALRRVEEGGGRIAMGPLELPGDSGIARCIDPQGAMFALQGPRTKDPTKRLPDPDIEWSSDWGEISSRGRLVSKPRS